MRREAPAVRDIKFLLQRDVCAPGFTLGRLFVEGMMYGFTCEDQDRKLEEEPGAKIPKRTAIPRGLYRLTLSFSNRFKKVMPLIKDVPGFDGVRIHGGNDQYDTEGCPLLGKTRTAVGVMHCAEVNASLIESIRQAEDQGDALWIEVQ